MEWLKFDHVEPIGGARVDWAAASINATAINLAAARVGSTRRIRPVDLMLEYGDEKPEEVRKEEPKKKEPSWQDLKFTARMWVADSKARKQKR